MLWSAEDARKRVQALFASHLEPGERDPVWITASSHRKLPLPYVFLGPFGVLIHSLRAQPILVGLTDARLILLEVTLRLEERSARIWSLEEVEHVELHSHLFERVLDLGFQDGSSTSLALPRWLPRREQHQNLLLLLDYFRSRVSPPEE